MSLHVSGAVAPSSTDRFLTIGECAERFRCSISALRLWTRQGRLKCYRKGGSALSHRVFKESDVLAFMSAHGNFVEESREGCAVQTVAIVSRVSTLKQRQDLSRQEDRLRAYVADHFPSATVKLFSRIASGINFENEVFLKLIRAICEKQFQVLVCSYKDRVCRFGFALIEQLCSLNGIRIICTEAEPSKDDHAELVEDLLSITHVFSCKHYSRRSIKTNSIPLSAEVVSQIVELHAAGHSQNVIFDTLKKAGKHKGEDGREFSIHVVRRVIRKHAKLAPVLAGSSALTSPAFSVPRSKRVSTFSLFWSENVRLGTPAAKLSRRILIKSYRQWCGTKGLVPTTPKLITKWLRLRFPSVLANRQKNEDGEIIYSGVWIRQSP